MHLIWLRVPLLILELFLEINLVIRQSSHMNDTLILFEFKWHDTFWIKVYLVLFELNIMMARGSLEQRVLTQCLYCHLACHCFRWLTMFCGHLKISGCWNHPAVANFTEIPNSMLVALQCPSHTILILIVWDSIRNFQSTVASIYIKKQSTWLVQLIKVSLKTSQNSQENYCARISFLNKFADWGPAILLKRDHDTGAFL